MSLLLSGKRASRWTWALPLFTAVICGVTAYVVTGFLPRIYRSEATLYFPATSGAGSSSGILGAVGGLRGLSGVSDSTGQVSLFDGALISPQVASAPQTAIAVMSSQRLRERVSRNLDLPRRWRVAPHEVPKMLEGAVAMGVDKNGLLAMEALDRDPNLAADILEQYIAALRQLAGELTLNVSTRNREFLEKRLSETRARLARMESRALEQSRREPAAAAPAGALTQALENLATLKQEATRAEVGLRAVNAQLAWQTEAARSALKSGAELPAHADLGKEARARLADLEARYALARAQLGPDHPAYRLLVTQLEEARRQLRREVERGSRALERGIAPEVVALRGEKASLEAKAAGLARAAAEEERRLAALPRMQILWDRLQAELRIQRRMVEYLETETERARIAETRDATTFQVIDSPVRPVEPVAPRRIYTSALSSVAGLLLGFAILVARAVMSAPRGRPLDMESELATVDHEPVPR